MSQATDPAPRPVDTDPEDERAAPPRNQAEPGDRRGSETPGDLDAPDIVGPTGEEMPVQPHDDVDGDHAATRDRRRA